MTREEAEKVYIEAIMEGGNPHYFIYRVVMPWTDDELIERMERLGIIDVEIEDE